MSGISITRDLSKFRLIVTNRIFDKSWIVANFDYSLIYAQLIEISINHDKSQFWLFMTILVQENCIDLAQDGIVEDILENTPFYGPLSELWIIEFSISHE